MSIAFFELLQSRVMLTAAGTPERTPSGDDDAGIVVRYTPKASSGRDGTTSFDDLVALATNYNMTTSSGSGSNSFAADWAIATSLVGEVPALQEPATLNSKGKLVLSMNSFDIASVSVTSKGATKVRFTRVGGHDELADLFEKSFKGVRSIELRGSAGDDSITLGEGVRFTVVHAGNGDDTIRGSSGDSALYGADGNDRIYGSGGNDSIYGEEGDDRLYGETGDDLLDGAGGKDRLDGGKGRNKLSGGSGTDYITIRSRKDKTDGDRKDRITDLT